MAEITPPIILFVTQLRNSLLLASTVSCVNCGPVAFRRDYPFIVKSFTDGTLFVPHKITLQGENVSGTILSSATLFDSTA